MKNNVTGVLQVMRSNVIIEMLHIKGKPFEHTHLSIDNI